MWDLVVFAALDWERRAATDALAEVAPGDAPRTWRGRLGDGGAALVVQTGIGHERARAAAAAVGPARRFLAAGCAGGLSATLATGDLVVARRVVPLDGAGRVQPSAPAEADGLVAALAGGGIPAVVGAVASSGTVLATTAAKRTAAGCGAVVVEMESAAVAAEAARRGIPFAGLRVVLDGVDDAVPETLALVDVATGALRWGGVAMLPLRPGVWGTVARLARQRRVAEASLRRALAAVLARRPPMTPAAG